jgi:hypothetical protein
MEVSHVVGEVYLGFQKALRNRTRDVTCQQNNLVRLAFPNLLDPRKKLIDSRASQKGSFCFHQELKTARRSLNFDLSVVSPIRAIWRGHITEVTYKWNLS